MDTHGTARRVLDDLDRDGYSIIEGYLDPADVAAKRADLHRILDAVPTGRNDFEGYSTRRIYALFAKTRAGRRAVMPAGSLMIYLGGLLHGGGANRTDRPRLGVILEYCAGWLRPQENHVLGVPKQIVQELPPRLQELLGYNVVGLLGNVDGRHPLKYLDDHRPVRDGVIDP